MKEACHARTRYKRFVIALPGHLAAQINTICEEGDLSYSNFFCKAAQAYLVAKLREPHCVTPTGKDEFLDNPAHVFGEWSSTADCVYDILQ